MSLREKSLFFLPIVIVAIIIANNITSLKTLRSNERDNSIVDIAGRQRFLSQKLLSDFLLQQQGNSSEFPKTVKLFLESSFVLEKGGEVFESLSNEGRMRLPAVPDGPIKKSVIEQRQLLNEFLLKAGRLHKNPETENYRNLLEDLLAANRRLVQKADDTVDLLDRHFEEHDEEVISRGVFLALMAVSIGIWLVYILYQQFVLTRRLKVATQTAVDAVQTRTHFFARVSHEIRNPLNIITAIPDILEKTPLNGDQSRYVTTLKYTSHNLLSVINDLLDISSLESGKLQIKKETMDLKSFLEQLVEANQMPAIQKNLSLKFSWDERIESSVCADIHRLRQIFDNLVGNAIKYTDYGFVEFKASLESNSGKFQNVIFSICDTGPGISKEEQKNIFSSFVRGKNKTDKVGTGLGLSISKQLVELMGGEIWIDSQLNQGAVFNVRLTLETVLAGTAAAPKKEEPTIGKEKIRVLYVDDSKDNLMVVSALLASDSRFEVVTVDNAAEAWKFFEEQVFDVVLLDIKMPNIDGISCAHHMREHEERNQLTRTPLVALSGAIVNEANSDFDFYLAKPITHHSLLTAVNKAIKSKGKIMDANQKSNFNKFFEKQIEGYLQRRFEEINEIKASVDQLDYAKISRMGHNIAGNAVTFGFPQIEPLGRRLETEANQNNRDAVLDLVAQIEAALIKSKDTQAQQKSVI